jgi:hypothetical protein
MSIDTPTEAVSALAQRLELGRFKWWVSRRPGLPGAVLCTVLLIVVLSLIDGPYNALTSTVMTLALLIIATWMYVWFRRTRGGLYVFDGGFVDAAGQRLIGVRWADVMSISAEETRYSVNLIPVGMTLHYTLKLRLQPRAETVEWFLNTTYANVDEVVRLISHRAGVPIRPASPSRR